MADDLAAIRARNSVGFAGESPPEAPADPLIGAMQALNKRLNQERVKENAVLDAAQRKAFGQTRKASATKTRKASRTPKPGKAPTTPVKE